MKRTNKVRLTESQLHQVIKESVKKILNEHNYEDYDYFYPDGTRGRDINPYPYDSDEARWFDENPEMLKKAEMDTDWNNLPVTPNKEYGKHILSRPGTFYKDNGTHYTDENLNTRELNPYETFRGLGTMAQRDTIGGEEARKVRGTIRDTLKNYKR